MDCHILMPTYQLRLFHFSNQSPTIINYAQAEEEKEKEKLTKAEKEARLKYKDKVTQRRKSVGPACATINKSNGIY